MKRTWKEDLNVPLWAISRPWLRVPVVIGLCPAWVLAAIFVGAVIGVWLTLCKTWDMVMGRPT